MNVFIESLQQRKKRSIGRGFCKACVLAASGFVVGGAHGENALTLLTLDGDVEQVGNVSEHKLRRVALAEGGVSVIVDEYALVRFGSASPTISCASQDFLRGGKEFSGAAGHLKSKVIERAPKVEGSVAGRGATQPGQPSETVALLIQHQATHPANHRFTPTPIAEFSPQQVDSIDLHGQRGFAIATVGETGRVMAVQVISSDGKSQNGVLQDAIARGVQTSFQDERRHDHTIYMSYEVQGQLVMAIGQPVVTLPMCCDQCPPPPYSCP